MATQELSPARSSNSRPKSSSPSSAHDRHRSSTVHLTPYNWSRPSSQSPDRSHNHPYGRPQWTGEDPRSSSMQSLRPAESRNGRRTLLLVYIHGFLGDETSFQSFPAHVHNILTITLAETHVVHTKIYPRYKSRGDISNARDAFSRWLSPHEDPNTDIILLGHSLGGILAAEVVLLPSLENPTVFGHRVLGLLAFDTPFLGMHPGVISSGIGSLFRSKKKVPEAGEHLGGDECAPPSLQHSPQQSSSGLSLAESLDPSGLFGPPSHDPNFNPSFMNDIHLAPQRKGWDRAWYFIRKHTDPKNRPQTYTEHGNIVQRKFNDAISGLTEATKEYVLSHWEFGGCLADYPGLKRRYARLRPLEDVDELADPPDPYDFHLRRVRFVNYYSASTGKLSARSPEARGRKSSEAQLGDKTPSRPRSSAAYDEPRSTSTSPRISLEEHKSDTIIEKLAPEADAAIQLGIKARKSLDSLGRLTLGEPGAVLSAESGRSIPSSSISSPVENENALDSTFDRSMESTPSRRRALTPPPIPDLPPEPPTFDSSLYSSQDALKPAQKEHSNSVKTFERARKDREKAIRDREKISKKRERQAQKEATKRNMLKQKQSIVVEKEQFKRQTTLNPEDYDAQIAKDAQSTRETTEQVRKKRRDRKFCTLPPKDQDGLRDPTWIRVYMEGVDEVEAHTSLFFLSPVYEKLVGDVSVRIEEWVKEDGTRRLLLEELGKQDG